MMRKFIIVDIDSNPETRDRIIPVVLAVPEGLTIIDDTQAKELVIRAMNQNSPHRRWRWNRKISLSEKDSMISPPLKAMFESVDWGSADSLWLSMPDNANEAYEYASLTGPSKAAEELLAADTIEAYRYAVNILKSRFAEGEEAIGKDMVKSVCYADMAKCRVVPGEDLISQNEPMSLEYGKIMKKHGLWGSWTEDEVARSPVWMYQYAKDHAKGRLPDALHNKMHLMSFENSENKWLRKYLGAKKYINKKRTA